MSSVASYDYPNDEDRPRSVSQLAKSYQQNSAISPPSYNTPSPLSTKTSNIEPPEQSSPHSVLSTNNTNNMSGSTTAEDPPEQNLSTKFNLSASNTHSRIRASLMSTSSIHNISRNAKGHVYLNGEDSSVDDVSSSCHGADATFTENKSVKIANEAHKIEPYGNTNNNNNQQRDIMLSRNGRKLNPSSAIVLDKHLSKDSSSRLDNGDSPSPTTKQKQLSKKEQRERNSIALAKQFNYNNNSPSPGQSTYEYKEKLKDDDSHVNYGYKVEDTTTQSSNKRDVVANRVKFADKYGGQIISKTRSWEEEEGVYNSSNSQGSRLGSSNSGSNQIKGAWRGNTQSSCDASVGSTETRRSNVIVSSPTTSSISSKPTVQYVTSSLSSTSRYTKSNFPPSYFRGVRTKKLPTVHTTNNKSSWLCGSCVGQQHGYLKKNAAILIVLVCIVCITTVSYFGLGDSSGRTNEGIENQLNHIETTGYATSGSNIRGLTDDYNNNQEQQLPMTAGYAQEMGYSAETEQQSTKGIMDGVHPLPTNLLGNNNGVIDWSTSQTTTGVGGQQVVDWSKVPPHLRGYYSKMVNVNAAQQSEQEQVISLEEQIDQGTSAQALLVDNDMDTFNVETVNVETTIDNIGEVAVPVIDMEEFARQQEVLEFNAGVAGIQEPPPPTVDDQSSSLLVDGSPPQDVLSDESLQGIDIQEDTSIPDESSIPDQVENTDEGNIIEGQEEEEPEYGMTMEEHEQMEQRIQQEEAEKLAIERLELQRGGGDQLSGGQQVVEILPATSVPGEDEQQQEVLEQQSLELQGDAYNNQEALLTSTNEEEVARQKQAEEDALLKAATIEEDQRASREQNPPEFDNEVAESKEQVVMNVSEEEAPAESLSPQEEVDQLENVQDQEETDQVPSIENEVQAKDESFNEQQQLDNERQDNQQENNDEDEIRIKKKKGKKKQKELEKLLKKEQKFQQRKQERIEQLKKERREAKKRKKQNQDDESNDSEIIEDEKVSEETSTTIDQLQKELNELAALLSQKT